MNKIEIYWLASCPKCDCSEHVVETTEGTKDYLFSGDKVTCGECEHTGEIDADFLNGVCRHEQYTLSGVS